MKLNHLFKSEVKPLSASVTEALNDLDIKAKEELDGSDLEDELDQELEGASEVDQELEDIEPEVDAVDMDEIPEPPESDQPRQGYDLNNVVDQINGMIEKWFQLAQGIDPSRKESFLKLGDRLSEIVDVIESEFSNAE